MTEPYDVVAVGAHPDDVEIACGGTLAKLSRQGYRVAIIDLPDGEPTPRSPGPEVRLEEARQAAEVLGVSLVTNLAAGISPTPLAHDEVLEAAAAARPRMIGLLRGTIERL